MTEPERTPEAPGSWLATWAEVEERQQELVTLVGQRVTAVRYVDIDYRQMERAGAEAGARQVVDPAEWAEPTWRFSSCHSLDWGVELDVGGETVSITWEQPGLHEGLAVYRGALVDRAVRADANRTEWDVTAWGPWVTALHHPVAGVDLRYEPFGDSPQDGFWCRLLTVSFADIPVRFALAEGRDEIAAVAPSADNIAVMFPEHPQPHWL